MSHTHHIVLEDKRPGKARAAGEVITEAEVRRIAGTGQRVYSMPVEPETLGMGAIAGFFRRDYGLKGAAMPDATPVPVCRLAMYSQARQFTIHWRARIALAEDIRAEVKHDGGSPVYAGALRLISDTSQGIPSGIVGAGPDTAFQFYTLVDEEHDGEGWVIGGSARSHAQNDGVFGWALHGNGRGFRVMWAAISQVG